MPLPPPQLLGQIFPGDSRLQGQEDARQTGPVGNPGESFLWLGRFRTQPRLDAFRRLIRRQQLARFILLEENTLDRKAES